MIKKGIVILIFGMLVSSCVSKKIYQELEDKYASLKNANSTLIAEKEDLISTKNELEKNISELQFKLQETKSSENALQSELNALRSKYNQLEESYNLLASNSSKEIAEKTAKNNALLTSLEEKELKLAKESERLEALENKLSQQQQLVEELNKLLKEKELQMSNLKNAISKALHGFEGNGLTVIQKNGKIYVSMENKLLFKSGSWAVGTNGTDAVKKLAKVLSENKDIEVLIEGHTDNVPYKGNGTLIDNWDLSVKRATAIVRILKDNGVNPAQIIAAGRSEYVPVNTNETTEGKAKNRRIEIIVSPNFDEISKLLKDDE